MGQIYLFHSLTRPDDDPIADMEISAVSNVGSAWWLCTRNLPQTAHFGPQIGSVHLGIVLRDSVLWTNVRKYNSPTKPD